MAESHIMASEAYRDQLIGLLVVATARCVVAARIKIVALAGCNETIHISVTCPAVVIIATAASTVIVYLHQPPYKNAPSG